MEKQEGMRFEEEKVETLSLLTTQPAFSQPVSSVRCLSIMYCSIGIVQLKRAGQLAITYMLPIREGQKAVPSSLFSPRRDPWDSKARPRKEIPFFPHSSFFTKSRSASCSVFVPPNAFPRLPPRSLLPSAASRPWVVAVSALSLARSFPTPHFLPHAKSTSRAPVRRQTHFTRPLLFTLINFFPRSCQCHVQLTIGTQGINFPCCSSQCHAFDQLTNRF